MARADATGILVPEYRNEPAMTLRRQVRQALDGDHRDSIEALGRIEIAFANASA
jgi:hypothetical protein